MPHITANVFFIEVVYIKSPYRYSSIAGFYGIYIVVIVV